MMAMMRMMFVGIGLGLVLTIGAYLQIFESQSLQFLRSTERFLSQAFAPSGYVSPYNQASIVALEQQMPELENMLLAFDGKDFRAYSLGPEKELTFRYVKAIPLMVHSLKTKFPERFKRGQPVFQMVWTMGDYLKTECVNPGVFCPNTHEFPPITSYSTVHRDETILPTVKAFPNTHFISCLFDWQMFGERTCRWQDVDTDLAWEDLTPTVVWRGADVMEFATVYDKYRKTKDLWVEKTFTSQEMAKMNSTEIVDTIIEHWHDLSPRWQAAALTLHAKLSQPQPPHWIDAMFTGDKHKNLHDKFADHGLVVADNEPMDFKKMSKYRYQVDFGGEGGTTWQDTLTKLQMPGVLFHHETPTKDWFYDLMEPWVHYVPVKTGLENLWSQWKWAEDNPAQAQRISQEASELAEYLLSEEYMKEVYDDLFGKYLGRVIDAYQAEEGKNWEECLAQYRSHGVGIHEVSQCSGKKCRSEWERGTFIDIY